MFSNGDIWSEEMKNIFRFFAKFFKTQDEDVNLNSYLISGHILKTTIKSKRNRKNFGG